MEEQNQGAPIWELERQYETLVSGKDRIYTPLRVQEQELSAERYSHRSV